MSRIADLETLLDASPDDPFLMYALASEYQNHASTMKALLMFEYLVNNHPEYIATYYPYSKILFEAGNRVQALNLIQQGIEWGIKQNDMHAVGEMKALLARWTDDD